MATIKEYFASAKLTPQDRGTTAFEQAGRRIGGFYEQIAQGDRQQGRDIGELWNEAKFGLDLTEAEDRRRGGGGGVGLSRGNVHDALDFGRPFGADAGANGRNTNESSAGPRANSYNAQAARGIGNAAASLPGLVTKLIDGQGLTDQQYQALGQSRSGAGRLFNMQHSVYGDYGKTGVAPTEDVSTEDAAKAGFNVDRGAKYGETVPTYPVADPMSTLGLPNINQYTGSYSPDLARIQAGGPETDPKDANSATESWQTTPGGLPGPGMGAQIWSGITNLLTTNPAQSTSEEVQPNDNETGFGNEDNPVQ